VFRAITEVEIACESIWSRQKGRPDLLALVFSPVNVRLVGHRPRPKDSGKDRHCTVGLTLTLRTNARSVRYQTYRSFFTPAPRHRRRPLPRLVPAKAISAGLDGLPESHRGARVEFNEK
jgi:hypothetical protein